MIWYKTAAERGDARGQFILGTLYKSGESVEIDDTLAIEWYQKSAAQGYALAEARLAQIKDSNRGVKGTKGKFRQALDFSGDAVDAGVDASIEGTKKVLDIFTW